jgi:hypothetical protein
MTCRALLAGVVQIPTPMVRLLVQPRKTFVLLFYCLTTTNGPTQYTGAIMRQQLRWPLVCNGGSEWCGRSG